MRRLLRNRQPDQALAVLDVAPANQGDRPGVLRLRGIAALAAGRPQQAVDAFQRLGVMRPESAVPRCLSAQALGRQGRIREARAAVIDAWRRNAQARCIAPTVRRLAAAVDESAPAAASAYEAILATLSHENPMSPGAAHNLAWLLHDSDPNRALTLARMAHEREPDNVAFSNTLGTLLLARGDASDALPLLAAAMKTRSEDAGLRYRYALALVETGEIDEARRLLMTLNDRHFAEQAEARALLQRIAR